MQGQVDCRGLLVLGETETLLTQNNLQEFDDADPAWHGLSARPPTDARAGQAAWPNHVPCGGL